MPSLSKLFPRLFRSSDNRTEKPKVDKNKECACKIMLLDDTHQTMFFKGGTKAHVVLNKVFEQLNLVERDYFGLRYLDETNQTHWLDPNKSIASQLRTPPPHTLYFGVKFYSADPCKLKEEITRYMFFLQVKRDILQGRLPIALDTAAELAAYNVQSELGDFDPAKHTSGYVSEFRFIPNQTEELESRVMQLHKALSGQVPALVEYRYLEKIKWLEMYGVDLHPVQGEGNMEFFIGLTPSGIVVYRNKSKVGNYFWPRISKINFKGKLFMIRVKDKNSEENAYTFECMTKAACKHLWKCCVEHHAFFRLSQANNSITTGKLFRLGSKFRYSGRTERQARKDSNSRKSPQVQRAPSKKFERRSGSLEARPSTVHEESVGVSASIPTVVVPEMNKHYRGYQSAPDSPRSVKSAPWESGHHRKGGLYTSGRDSPMSVMSDRIKFPHRRPQSGSESEASYYPNRRRRETDYESDASSRYTRYESASESEASHRRHRRNRRSEEVSQSEAHWREMERRIRDGYQGSISSMPGSESSQQRRRHRRRSRSPGNKPPEELAQHFKYVEPQPDMTAEQMRDIPYTEVSARVDPRWLHKVKQHRHRSPGRKSTSELMPSGNTKEPVEEPPPPYQEPVRKPVENRTIPNQSYQLPTPYQYQQYPASPRRHTPNGHASSHGYHPAVQLQMTPHRQEHSRNYAQPHHNQRLPYGYNNPPPQEMHNGFMPPTNVHKNAVTTAPVIKTAQPSIGSRDSTPSHSRDDSGLGGEQDSPHQQHNQLNGPQRRAPYYEPIGPPEYVNIDELSSAQPYNVMFHGNGNLAVSNNNNMPSQKPPASYNIKPSSPQKHQVYNEKASSEKRRSHPATPAYQANYKPRVMPINSHQLQQRLNNPGMNVAQLQHSPGQSRRHRPRQTNHNQYAPQRRPPTGIMTEL